MITGLGSALLRLHSCYIPKFCNFVAHYLIENVLPSSCFLVTFG